MADKENGNNRIADIMQGHPLDFGGIGNATWRTSSEVASTLGAQVGRFGSVDGFDMFATAANLSQPDPRLRAKVFKPPVVVGFNDENLPPDAGRRAKVYGAAAGGGSFQVFNDDENARRPVSTRSRAKTFSQVAAGGFPVFNDDENRPPLQHPSRAKTFGQLPAAASFQVFDENKPVMKTFSKAAATGLPARDDNQLKQKTLAAGAAAASAGFQIYDEDAAAAGPKVKPLVVRSSSAVGGEGVRPTRAQQRKQKLKQRPLQELQNTKRAALQAAVARLPAAISLTDVPPSPPPAGAAGESDKENTSPQVVYEALLRPAAPPTQFVCDVSMTSPGSLHTSFDSITLGTRRSRVNALYSYEEYAADLHLIMRQAELEHRPRTDFMARQPDITVTMRSILVDWLVEVNEEYKLNAETLHLAVNYIDRFLSVMTVVRAKLQLVGTCALFIASKYEEIYPPTVAEFVYITDDTYTASQLKRMEHVMLKMLAFDMSAPTANWFLNYYLDNGGPVEDTVKYLAQLLAELALVQYQMCNRYVSSVQAAAALCLARLAAGHEPWPAPLERVSGLSREDVEPCLHELLVLYQTARDLPQQAVLDKFSKDKFLSVSQLDPPAAITGWN